MTGAVRPPTYKNKTGRERCVSKNSKERENNLYHKKNDAERLLVCWGGLAIGSCLIQLQQQLAEQALAGLPPTLKSERNRNMRM